ncbi:MAG: glycosyltransferase family 4 protein [Ignavibacteriaceae bacterium]|nr:glycosyltransferase family 4 protein [Ignavibacteriaceae bacterium]
MKVLYDHQCFSMQEYGGISRYFYHLIKEFKKDDEMFVDLSLRYSNNHYINSDESTRARNFLGTKNFKGKKILLEQVNRQESIKTIKRNDFDIFHPTYYNSYFLKHLGNKPFILSVFDMTHEIFPHIAHRMDKTIEYKKLLVKNAKRIIAISQNTKNDLINLLKADPEKIEVIRLASSINREMALKPSDLKLPERYILYVGSRNYYKNFNNVLMAFKELVKNYDSLFLICGGGGMFNDAEIELFRKNDLSGKILHRHADDVSLATLYSNAILFAFPSLYEGFGIPVLEAMNCNCPMVLSNSSSLPEVGGDAAIYFDPNDSKDISNQMSKIIYDAILRKDLMAKGEAWRKKFSWQKTAIETKKLYEQSL